MSKRNKFKGTNAQLVGDTRLTKRQMKKMEAAYHNVRLDFASRFAVESAKPQTVNEDIVPAQLDM